MDKQEFAIKAAMQKVMANLTKGMKLAIEVEDVLGKNISALNVEAHGGTKEAAENEENREKEKFCYLEAAFGDILICSLDCTDALFQDPSELKECWQKLYDRIQYHAKKINDKYNK